MEKLRVNQHEYVVLEEIKNNDKIVTFLCELNNNKYIIEMYKDMEIDVERLVNNYFLLRQLRINVPRLFDYSLVNRIIVKEYIESDTVSNMITNHKFTNSLYFRLMNMITIMKKKHRMLDFDSHNFLFYRSILYYNSYVIFDKYDLKLIKDKYLSTWIVDSDKLSLQELEDKKEVILTRYNVKIRKGGLR